MQFSWDASDDSCLLLYVRPIKMSAWRSDLWSFFIGLMPNRFIRIIYVIYLIPAIILILLPPSFLKTLDLWTRASLLSIFFTVFSAIVFFFIIWRSKKLAIGHRSTMVLTILLVLLVITPPAITILRWNVLAQVSFHLWYAESVVLLFMVIDGIIYINLKANNPNKSVLRNTVYHVDVPMFIGCSALLIISAISPFITEGMLPSDLSKFVTGALTFQFLMANTAYATTQSRLKL